MTVTTLIAYNLYWFSQRNLFWNIPCTNLIFLFPRFNRHYKLHVYDTTIRLKFKWDSVENDLGGELPRWNRLMQRLG